MSTTTDQPAYVHLKRQRDDGDADVFEANLARNAQDQWQVCLERGASGAGEIAYSESDFPNYAAAKVSFLARCKDRLRRGYALVRVMPEGWTDLISVNNDSTPS